MNPVVEIRPSRDGTGFTLKFEDVERWYAQEIHAINYAQDLCAHCDVVVYFADGTVKHRYSSMRPG